MKVVIAPDSFKSCLSAAEVAEALAAGWQEARPGDTCALVPMADGGEGTVDALVAAAKGEYASATVTGPLGDPIEARYGLIDGGKTAVIEMAAASGLPLIHPKERDPLKATTYGTGELIRDALGRGARRILLGLGGSATNDAGAGMAQALGFRLLDANGSDLVWGGAALADLDRIDASGVLPELAECEISAACDVDNPLCGPQGASHIYGPQKGASPAKIEVLDAALARFADVVARDMSARVLDMPGAGAAGGLGAGVVAFLHGSLKPGAELVAKASGLAEEIAGAKLVITGEGRIDAQTVMGKTPAGVAAVARTQGVPVIGICGLVGEGYETVREAGISAVFPIAPGPVSFEKALRTAPADLKRAGEELARLYSLAEGNAF